MPLQMSFHAPVKELQPVDTSLPQHIIKGAVVIDPQLSEWNKKSIISSATLPSAFVCINRLDQKIGDVLKSAANELRLSESESYGLIADAPKRFITDENLEGLDHGFILTLSASPDHYVHRINEILTEGNDLRKMEWAIAKLDEFSLDPALIEAFYRCSSLNLLFSLVRDDRVCMSSTLLSTCLRALSSMLELGVGSVGWQAVPKDVVVSISALVTGKAKREEANTLLGALQMIEQLVIGDDITRDSVLEEVPIETLIRHVEKSDERIALAALSLMNSMIARCSNKENRINLIRALEVVPFRNAVHNSLLRGGTQRDPKVLENLVEVQRSLISVFDTSPASDCEIQKVLHIDTAEEHNEENTVALRDSLMNSRCGKLGLNSLLDFVDKNPQDLRMLMSENIMRIEGGKWNLIPMGMRCAEIVGELLGILPGKNELERLISILFSSDNPFNSLYGSIIHLFHRTWREMQAKEGEMEKVANVVMEQLRYVLKDDLEDVEDLGKALEKLSYREMQKIWKEEQTEKENDQLHSDAVIELGQKLRFRMEEIVRINFKNYLKRGAVFKRQAKTKNLSKVAYWFWKLDGSEKLVTITICESEDHFDGDCDSHKNKETKQIWLKDIMDISHSDEIDRKNSASRFATPPSSMMLRGITIQTKGGENFTALTSDEKQAAIWIESLSQLIGKCCLNNYFQSSVDRMLKMELRVRLLNVNLSDINQKQDIPQIPKDFISFVEKVV